MRKLTDEAPAQGVGGDWANTDTYILETPHPNANDVDRVCGHSSPTMALSIPHGAPSIVILRPAYEASGLVRATIDERLGLTPDEFRVEGGLVVIGPIHGSGADVVGDLIAELERLGLRHFDDFFELSGNWPAWLQVFAAAV